MLSSQAEELLWAGRYIERAEDTARMLDVTYHAVLEARADAPPDPWWELLEVLNSDRAFRRPDSEASAAAVTGFLMLDPENPGSIVCSIARARENVRSVRERVSTELWEGINGLYLDLRSRDLRADLEGQPYDLYRMVKLRCQTLAGVAEHTMLHDDGWRFFNLGWMLERAEMTCRILNVRYRRPAGTDGAPAFHRWVALLRSASGLEAYRLYAQGHFDPALVLEFLLLCPTFPRSVLFLLHAAEAQLMRVAPPGVAPRPQRIIGRLRAELEFRDVREVLQSDLHGFLEHILQGIWKLSDAIAAEFFRRDEDRDLYHLVTA